MLQGEIPMFDLAAIGYVLSAAFFALLSLLLSIGRYARFQGYYLFGATMASAIWAGLSALHAYDGSIELEAVWAAEVVRNLLWIMLLIHLLRPLAAGSVSYGRVLGYVRLGALLLALMMLLALKDFPGLRASLGTQALQQEFSLIGQLLFSVLGMALVEQLYRNTREEQRSRIKHFCFGLAIMFVYDFYMYSDALLFRRMDIDIWSARGGINLMVIPLLGMTIARNPEWDLPVMLSRRMVFHSTALLGAGTYMLLMAVAGYYIRLYGGEWGTVLQIVFLVGALVLLGALLFSGTLRSRVKVFLNKHFFSYRYDYREEWLRLIDLLARRHELPLQERTIWALSEIADSPGGALWLIDDKSQYREVALFNHLESEMPTSISSEQSLMRLMQAKQWIVELDEGLVPEREDEADLEMPECFADPNDYWLLVPLMREEKMLGFVSLLRPRVPQELNWENRDLLKTAGMQAASYLALYQAAEALADVRQFEGFNRLSAFVIHDLKNLIAQLSLVAKNAAKHKHNPDFVDDAVNTIENSVLKMNRLMAQLQSADAFGEGESRRIDLVSELRSLVEVRSTGLPKPQLKCETEKAEVLGQGDRLGAVLGHVLQNALDATPADGNVWVVLRTRGGNAIVEIRDTGVGMDKDFIERRLFRPFDSTKGLAGMGIGAYECREVVQAAGGQVNVDSTLGKGTVFRIMLPLVKAAGEVHR